MSDGTSNDGRGNWQDIYLGLRQRLLDLQFLPGQIIRPAAVVSHYEMTLSDVRRALAALQGEGYVTGSAAGTYVVRRWSDDELRDAFELRASLVELGVNAAVRAANPVFATRLREHADLTIDEARVNDDIAELATRRLWQFEDDLLRGLGLPDLAGVLPNAMSPSLHRATVRLMTNANLIAAFARLDEIAVKIGRGNSSVAGRLARAHVLLAAELFIESYGSLNPLPREPEIDLEGFGDEIHNTAQDEKPKPHFGLGRPEE